MEAAENGLLRKAGCIWFDMFIWLSYKLLRLVLLRVNPRVPVRGEGGGRAFEAFWCSSARGC